MYYFKIFYTKNIRLFILCALGTCLLSCTKNFELYNTNPNQLKPELLDYDNLSKGAYFTVMQQGIFPFGGVGSESTNSYQASENLCGDIYGGYHGMTHNWNAAGDGTNYNFSQNWNATAFNLLYGTVMINWQKVRNSSKTDNPDLYATAQIIKAHAAQRTVDMYGAIPYSKALVGLSAAYDPADAIYYSVLKELDSAITTLKTYAAIGAKPLALFDVVYRGDYTQWIKFANSLKLRMAMRMVYADPTKAKEYAESAINDSYGVITSTADNAIIRGTNGKTYGNPLGGLTNDYSEARMSANMESFLNGYSDPRKSKYFIESAVAGDPAGSFRGIRSGIIIASQLPYNSFSKLTSDFNITWLTASEVYFLRAEGALRGWNMGGTAQTFYESGVKSSFEQWGAGDATTYLQNSTNKPAEYKDPVNSTYNVAAGANLSTMTIKWDELANFETKLERIITQKWIAIYPNGQEAWSEFRRTRYPKIFPIAENKSGGLVNTAIQIRRIPYPAAEYRTNAKNVAAAVTLLGGPDNGGTKIWWDKKP